MKVQEIETITVEHLPLSKELELILGELETLAEDGCDTEPYFSTIMYCTGQLNKIIQRAKKVEGIKE